MADDLGGAIRIWQLDMAVGYGSWIWQFGYGSSDTAAESGNRTNPQNHTAEPNLRMVQKVLQMFIIFSGEFIERQCHKQYIQ